MFQLTGRSHDGDKLVMLHTANTLFRKAKKKIFSVMLTHQGLLLYRLGRITKTASHCVQLDGHFASS